MVATFKKSGLALMACSFLALTPAALANTALPETQTWQTGNGYAVAASEGDIQIDRFAYFSEVGGAFDIPATVFVGREQGADGYLLGLSVPHGGQDVANHDALAFRVVYRDGEMETYSPQFATLSENGDRTFMFWNVLPNTLAALMEAREARFYYIRDGKARHWTFPMGGADMAIADVMKVTPPAPIALAEKTPVDTAPTQTIELTAAQPAPAPIPEAPAEAPQSVMQLPQDVTETAAAFGPETTFGAVAPQLPPAVGASLPGAAPVEVAALSTEAPAFEGVGGVTDVMTSAIEHPVLPEYHCQVPQIPAGAISQDDANRINSQIGDYFDCIAGYESETIEALIGAFKDVGGDASIEGGKIDFEHADPDYVEAFHSWLETRNAVIMQINEERTALDTAIRNR